MFKNVKPVITVFDEPVSDVLSSAGKLIIDYPINKVWNENGISLASRLKDGSVTTNDINKLLSAANLERYIVPASLAAPTRCIDGRITEHWDISTSSETTLGPKIAGGTAHAALAHRVVDVGNLKRELLFESDIQHVIRTYKQLGIGFGGHIDDGQKGSNTGCGAVDNINLILDRLQLPEPQEQLRGLTHFIMGSTYVASLTSEMIGRLLYLDALKPKYLPRENDDPTGEFLYKQIIVETIRNEAKDSAETVPALTGTHNEVALMLNFRLNTTIDTDRLSYDNENKLQVFGWDIWEMYEEARALYPYDMHQKIETQREAVENRVRHITTRTLLGIATTMVLTDGSLKLLTVK